MLNTRAQGNAHRPAVAGVGTPIAAAAAAFGARSMALPAVVTAFVWANLQLMGSVSQLCCIQLGCGEIQQFVAE